MPPVGIIEDQEEMVGTGHPTKADTLNRGFLIEHTSAGAHKPSYGELFEYTPAGTVISLPVADVFVKWDNASVGLEAGAGLIVGSAANDKMVVGAQGGGVYKVFEHVVYVAPIGNEVTVATFLNAAKQIKLTETATLGGASKAFPDSVDIKLGTLISGTVADVQSQDAVYLQVEEVNLNTGHIMDFAFSGVGTPKQVNFVGRYEGSSAHEVEVQIFDFTATVDDVQDAGVAYRCIRSHTSAASNQPGSGPQWTAYWESLGAPSGEPAWVVSTAYVDGFVDIRAAIKDLPSASVDYERHWLVPGAAVDRKDFVDGTGNVRVRTIHTSLGNTAHDMFYDLFSLEDDQGSKSVTSMTLLQLASTDEIDLRFASGIANAEIEITSVNLVLERIKII